MHLPSFPNVVSTSGPCQLLHSPSSALVITVGLIYGEGGSGSGVAELLLGIDSSATTDSCVRVARTQLSSRKDIRPQRE
jgi:hypothetical protein